jgi:hypothetical protein
MSFETMNGTRVGAVAGWPQPGALLMSGALAQTEAKDPEGDDEVVDEPHAMTSKASAHRSGTRRRGLIADRVSPSVGTCRRGRMTPS